MCCRTRKYSKNLGENEENISIFTILLKAAFRTKNVYSAMLIVEWQFFLFFRFNPGTGHYTQIVWGETSKIGCGASIYRKGQFFKKFVVCNYGKGGNLLRASMYKTGNPCSECPGNTVCSQQYPGLCQSNGAAGQLPVIVPQISPNVPPTNTLDQMRPSTPIGISCQFMAPIFFAFWFFAKNEKF